MAAKWGAINVVGCYISPNLGLIEFELYLDRVGDCVNHLLPRPVIVAGDFNAKSVLWRSRRTNASTEALKDWVAVIGLRIINTGTKSI